MDISRIDINSVLTIVGFITALIWQSAVIKAELRDVRTRLKDLEIDLKEVVKLLVLAEKLTVRLDAIERRMDTLEKRCFSVPPGDRKP